MSALLHRLIVPVVLATTVACTSDPASPIPEPISELPRSLTSNEQVVSQGSNAFAFALFKRINESFADSNVFISPLSASMALGMTANGAAGETQSEMLAALGLSSVSPDEANKAYRSLIELLRGLDKSVDFRIANSIWYRNELQPFIEQSFVDAARDFFDAEVSNLDFASPSATSTINDWVRTSTNGKIDKMVDQIPDDIVMYLMNAIYFKGDWRARFDKQLTKPGQFRTNKNEIITAQLMNRKGGFVANRLSVGTLAVEMGYGSNAFVMTAILPPEGADINTFVESFSPELLDALTAEMDSSDMILTFPKFRLTWEDSLNDELKALGMRQAFIPDGADFTGMSKQLGRNIYISGVSQKTFVDVSEEGTEAAAATSVGAGTTSLPPSANFSRPFIFLIREKLSGTILFVGKIVRPTISS